MNILIIILFPSIFNIPVVMYKRKKTLDKMCNNFEEQGYIVDSRLKNNIPFEIIANYKKYDVSNYHLDLSFFSWFPVVNWFSIVSNIKYLLGDYTGGNECYAALEDLSLDKSVVRFLEKEDLLKVDLKKQMWLADKENAMKELEKLEQKYDNENIKEKVVSSSIKEIKNNNLEEDNIKLMKLFDEEGFIIQYNTEENKLILRNPEERR